MARKSASDLKLKEISEILFPRTKVVERTEEGQKIKFMIDYSIDSNLYAALIDLQEGHNDQACHNTINKCISALNKVRNILEASMFLDEEAKYIMVDMLEDEDFDNVTTREH
jgi:hypothetical protein